MIPAVALEQSSVDWFARLLGLAGFAVALVSVTWQVAEYALTGSRVKVEPVRFGIAGTDPEPMKVVSFVVRNRGRMPTTVENWGFLLESGQQLVFPKQQTQWENPKPRSVIEPGTGKMWTVPLDWIRSSLVAEDQTLTQEMKVSVLLGTGKTRTSRKGFRLPR